MKITLSAKQEVVVRKMRSYFGKKKAVTGQDLKDFMKDTFGFKYPPAFIRKNPALRVKDAAGKALWPVQFMIPEVSAKPLSMTKDAIRKRAQTAANTGHSGGGGTPVANVAVTAPKAVAKSKAKAAGTTSEAVATPVETVEV